MSILRGALGLGDAAALGDAVRLDSAGLEPVEGSVDYVSPSMIGLRTSDALYRFAFIPVGGGIYLGHHVYRDDVDVEAVTVGLGGLAGPGGRRRPGGVRRLTRWRRPADPVAGAVART